MTIQLPSLLSFERKLETSDGLMYSGNWSDISYDLLDKTNDKKDSEDGKKEKSPWKKIKITQRFNRSTQSAHGVTDAKKSEPNPVSSGNDDANLPHDKDTLKISFTLRIIGNLGTPFACNAPDFEKKIKEKVNAFKGDENDDKGLATLADRYASNIANGRFLWRNRVCADDIITHVFIGENKTPLEFKSDDYTLNDFNQKSSHPDLKKLSQIIQTGFNSENDFVFIKINAYVKLGDGQHVFPSEEMNMNEKGKTLFKLEDCAAMHNVKIGNAIRTIDNWYKKDAEFPIAIEPYGSVTQRGEAYRKSKNDLYTLMVSWVNDKDDSLNVDEKNYVVANLIRGGVFSRKSS